MKGPADVHRGRAIGHRMRAVVIAFALVLCAGTARFHAASPIAYRFSFPEPAHHWMQVEARFPDVGVQPLELRFSRSSPGRYSIHDFAKNVYDVHAFGVGGAELALERPDASGWIVSNHGGAVTVRYKVFGDRVDGTYLAIDRTHAHINMPAAILWARGLDDRPSTLTFDEPRGAAWRVATQLHPGETPLEFTAPNLQYLIDSPVEFGPVSIRTFTIDGHTFRFAAHHTGTDAELDGFVPDVEKIVREERAVFGEYPPYEPGTYTFLADYLPYAAGDGMEHRNSTVMTSPFSIHDGRSRLLGTVAHEFFHNWNVERIRPRDLEPFDLDRENASADLWLAEGFTDYYERLVLERTGLADLTTTLRTMGQLVDEYVSTGAHRVRTAEDVSRMAPFFDGARPIDRTNWSTTYVSYYDEGDAIALALDLALRGRSDGRVSLDDFMRAMWRAYGEPGGSREGYVDHPYTTADAEAQLADASGDPAFARDFFARYIDGHEVADYAALLRRAGLIVRRSGAGRAWWGDLRFENRANEARVTSLVAPTWPAYAAGLEEDDTITEVAGQRIASPSDVDAALRRHRPGEQVTVMYVDRTGRTQRTSVALGEDPHVEIVPVESTGVSLTPSERAFREAWLASRVR